MTAGVYSESRWALAPVASMVDLVNGFPFDSSNFGAEGTPLVRIRDLTADEFETFVPEPVPERVLLDNGDVVIGMDGDFNVIRWGRGRAALNQRLCRLRGSGDSDVRFVEYALPPVLEVVNDTQHATTVKHLSSSEILSARIPKPSLEEQRRIADYLDDRVARIDAWIASRASQIDHLTDLLRSTAHDAVTGSSVDERRQTSLMWAGTLPQSWAEPRICYVARMGTGHTPSRSVPEYWVESDLPWLTTGDVHRFRHDEIDRIDDTVLHISELGVANSAAVVHPAGTVALSRTASAGFSIIMDVPMATSQDYATWTPGDLLSSEYLLWCLRVMRPDIMGRLAIGSTHKTIYFPDLMSIRIPLPTLVEQHAAVDQIREAATWVSSGRDVLTASIERLRELRTSVITAAVTGALDVVTASRAGEA